MTITVMGAGAWGTALAIHFARHGHDVTMWARNAQHVQDLAQARENARYLPGFAFPDALQMQADLGAALQGSELVLMVTSVAGLRDSAQRLIEHNAGHLPVLTACKGFEQDSGLLTFQVVKDVLPDNPCIGVLSGPSFAQELARQLPCAVVLASENKAWIEEMVHELNTQVMRLYGSEDVIGVAVGGAVKNIMAIATGLSDGLVVNIGTLNQHSINAMYLSAQAACRKNIPRVLDPVGVGASYLRQHTVHELLQLFRFSAIRGNAGEIAFLAQAGHRSKGIDAGALEADPLQIAQTVARRYQSIVVMTGAEDYITDGHTTYLCRNGHSMMAVLVGTGCIASAVVGAFIAAHNHNMLEAAAAAISFYGLCGETAAASAQGPGSLQTLLLDNLYHLPREAMDQGCRLIRL